MLPAGGKNAVFQPPIEEASHLWHTLCQVLNHGNEQQINYESSCPCYYSQIEGLGLLHVVFMMHYTFT